MNDTGDELDRSHLEGWTPIDHIPTDIEMNQVGRVTAAASSVELQLFLCLVNLVPIQDVQKAFALFGGQSFEQSNKMVRRVIAQLKEGGESESFGKQWDDALNLAKNAMDRRGLLLHSTWTGSIADGGRERGTAGFTPWKEFGSASTQPRVLTWQWIMQLGNDLERAAVRIGELQRAARP